MLATFVQDSSYHPLIMSNIQSVTNFRASMWDNKAEGMLPGVD